MNQPIPARVAFFGGSFDPPHAGHLAIARAARTALRLDRVLFAPVGVQPLKPAGATATFEQRLAMTRLAIADEPAFELSRADAPSPSGQPNFTVQTLERLRATLEPHDHLFCLIGADSFRLLRQWRQAERLPRLASLIVAARPGQSFDDLTSLLPAGLQLAQSAPDASTVAGVALFTWRLSAPDGHSFPLYLLPELDEPASATGIRAGASGQLPDAVANYIQDHGLYR